MDVFRNMELFVEVAASGGFRAAAERLGIPNSTVSRRIAELEHDIGLRLFHRTTRRVELTEAGRLYYDRCRRITDEARLAHEELSGMVRQPTGTIRASVPVDFALIYLTEILDDFTKAYPSIQLDLDVSPRNSDLVAEPFDVTIRIGPVTEPNLIVRKLSETKVGLFAAPSYLAERTVPLTPQDLLAHDCLRIADRPWRLHSSSETLQIAVQGPITANNIGLLHRLTLKGLGIGSLPTNLVAPDLAAGRLRPVLTDWHPGNITVNALTETKLLPAKVRVFIDFLIERLKTPS